MHGYAPETVSAFNGAFWPFCRCGDEGVYFEGRCSVDKAPILL